MELIPDEEFDTITESICKAIRFAEQGRFAAGYDCLLRGLKRTEEPPVNGRSYQQTLFVVWLTAVEEYSLCYGVPIGIRV